MRWKPRRTLFDAVTQTAVTDAEAAAKLAKTKAMRRFTWVRYPHDLPDKPLWRRVARMAGAPIERVEALVVRLEVHASANKPRGFVEDIDLAAIAAHWNQPSDEPVGRIYAALEQVGWIDQGYVATFWERNPDEEGETAERQREGARARQQRHRAKLKAEKEATRQATYPRSRDVTRDSVTVTPRADLNIHQTSGVTVENRTAAARGEEAVAEQAHGQSVHCGDIASPELWLALEGKRIVTEHLNMQPLLAETEIERWKRKLGGDSMALATILRGAASAGYRDWRFRGEVDAAIARRPNEGQRVLPLPMPLKGAGGRD